MDEEAKQQKAIGHNFIIATFLLAMVLLFFLFDSYFENESNPNQDIATIQIGENREVYLKRNRGGHYVTSGKINGQTVTFIIDTGASDISIPGNVANRLGLKKGSPRRYQTANGIITGYTTRLDSVSIGDVRLNNVSASINPNIRRQDILLGMSFLKHIEFSQRGDTLILRQ